MPTYQYRCTECGNDLEAVQKFSDPALTECPVCHGSLRKVFNAVGVVFKGSGFYRTDSRPKEGSSNGSSSSSSEAKGKDSSTNGSSEKSSSAGSTSGSTNGAAGAKTESAKTAPAKASSGSSTGSGASS